MYPISTNAWCLAVVNTPIGRPTWKMQFQKHSDGAYGEQGFDSLDLGCCPVVSLAAYPGPVRSGLSSTHLIILAHNDQGG
jgi:hypothetical protein